MSNKLRAAWLDLAKTLPKDLQNNSLLEGVFLSGAAWALRETAWHIEKHQEYIAQRIDAFRRRNSNEPVKTTRRGCEAKLLRKSGAQASG